MKYGNDANSENIEIYRNILNPANMVLRKGYQDLLYEDDYKRILLWNKLEESRQILEENTSLSLEEYHNFESKIALARLKLATTFHNNGDFTNITENFTKTEMELFLIVEEFRIFDSYSIEEIKKSIKSKDSKIYKSVKNHAEKMNIHSYKIFENYEIRESIAHAIKDSYEERTEKIENALVEYLSQKDTLFDT